MRKGARKHVPGRSIAGVGAAKMPAVTFMLILLIALTLQTIPLAQASKFLRHRRLAGEAQQQFDDYTVTPSDLKCSSRDYEKYFFRGQECHIANIWPDGPCPVPGACVPACSRCIAWRRGELPIARAAARSKDDYEKKHSDFSKASCDSTIWSKGSWRSAPKPDYDGDDDYDYDDEKRSVAWLPSKDFPQCSRKLLSPGAVYQCLKGKRVFLFGDSMIRPLMGRLVAYMRHLPQYVDRQYHQPGGYYIANGTHDAFVEGGFLPSLNIDEKKRTGARRHSYDTDAPEWDWDPAESIQMQFYWAPFFVHRTVKDVTHPHVHDHFGVLNGADVMIAGPMYHDLSLYESFRGALLKFFRIMRIRTGKRVPMFFWIASIPMAEDPPEKFYKRNRQMRAFINMLNDRADRGDTYVPRQSYYVDTELMAATCPETHADVHHFQCNVHVAFPGKLVEERLGAPEDKDCRDPYNLNVMQTVLKVACDY